MKKHQALALIIEQISGHNDEATIAILCTTINDSSYCAGVSCDDCPLNSSANMDQAAIEMKNTAARG